MEAAEERVSEAGDWEVEDSRGDSMAVEMA